MATEPAKVTVPIPADASTIVIVGCAGDRKAGLAVNLTWDDQSITKLAAKAGGYSNAPDAYLQIAWNLTLHIRPNLNLYADSDRKNALLKGWRKLPPASEHLLKIEIRTDPQGAQLWLDSRFVQVFPTQTGRVTKLDFSLPVDAGIKEISWSQATGGKFLPLTVGDFSRPAAWPQIMGALGASNVMADATLSLAPGPTMVDGIPFKVSPASRNVDVSGMGILQCPTDDLVSFYWKRSTVDALPEACIISVPQDTYTHAYVLCAAVDDPTKVPEFNLRMTRNANGRGDAFADSPVRIPKTGEKSADAKQVGTVAYGPEAGRKTVPLWLIRVPLKSGLIQDILREDETKFGFRYPLPTPRYLDVELMEPLSGVDENDTFPADLQDITKRTYKPSSQRTSVHVFGLTLESSPAELVVRPSTPANAFYAAEKPTLNAEVLPKESGKYALAWSFADVDGKIAVTGTKELNCTAGTSETFSIPVTVANGWYATQVKLRDSRGRDLVDQRGTFVMLPPDTRQAGAESPHGTWWFNWAHGGRKDYAHVGTLMQRAGLRHTILESDSLMAPYQVTTWCIRWKQPRAESVEMWVNDLEAQIRKGLEGSPNINTVMIHHESDSYGGRFPSELWGEAPPPLSEKNEAAWQNRMKHLVPGLKMIREKFPQLKIQIGNTGDSCALVAEMFRHGLPKDCVDYVAVEDLGQTFIPETPTVGGLQSAWYLRETARHFGYTNTQITACYEWIGRMHMKLGLRTQAEWYIRDALHARAYGFKSMALGSIHDAGQGYFHTIWGNGGLCFRYPYMYPKPVYAAMATHTLILDSAKFERLMPTGSLSLYAMEFQRAGQWIYTIWIPRGCRETKLAFESDADITITDLYGRVRNATGKVLDLTASTSAQYVVSRTRIASIACGKSSFPADLPPKNFTLVDPLESMATWSVDTGNDMVKFPYRPYPFRVPVQGRYEAHAIQDLEKGQCIEVELFPVGKLSPMMYEQVRIKLKEPKPQRGLFEYVGVWVKGNSSWGEVVAEVAGEDGKTTTLTPDWAGSSNINFDGWNFLRLRLPSGPNWKGPVTLTGFVLTIPRQVLYGTEFTPVTDLKIRLKDACFF